MKKKIYKNIFAVMALILVSAAGAYAQKEHQHDMSMMDKSGMMNEPHHVLAMAYMQNTRTFTKALHHQAKSTSPLDPKFVSASVEEIKRNHAKMVEHHEEHMKNMSPELHTKMESMIKEKEMHHAMLKDAVSALDKDVQGDKPDSTLIATDSANILKHLDEMLKMHDDKMKKKMKKM